MQNVIDTLETVRQLLIKLNIHLPYDPGVSLLAVYPSELETYVHTHTLVEVNIYDNFIPNCQKQEAMKILSTGE